MSQQPSTQDQQNDTTDTTTSQPESASAPEWEIADYQTALSHLSSLQGKLNNLRTIIPSLAAPLRKPVKSKTELFTNVRDAGSNAAGSLENFVGAWRDEETSRILHRSRESLRKDADLTKGVALAGEEVGRWGWSEV